MMSSRSIVSTSSLVALAIVLWLVAPVEAGRRVVVLEFDGPKAEKFRGDVEAAIKKAKHTIVPLDEWAEEADDQNAAKVTARNIKKVAKTLGVDGVVVGDVEKRGSRYYVHLRLREGVSGEYVAEVEIVVRQPKLGSDGAKVIKDELVPAIQELTAIKAKPKAQKKKKARDDDDDEADWEDDVEDEDGGSRKSGFGGKKAKKKKGRAVEEEEELEEEEEEPVRKSKKVAKKDKKPAKKSKAKAKKKPAPEPEEEEEEEEEAEVDEDDGEDDERVAAADDGEEVEEEVERDRPRDLGPVDPRLVAAEVHAGMSANMRRLGFTGTTEVQGYRGNPVAGVVVAADVYPLAFSDGSRGVKRNLGLTFMVDRVIRISSRFDEDGDGAADLTLPTSQQRYSVGLIYRHLLGDKAMVEATVQYGRMTFEIDKTGAPATITIPNVDYAMIQPGVALRYQTSPTLELGAGLGVGLVTGTGEMQQMDQYGAASAYAIDVEAGATYQVTEKIDLRGDLRATSFSLGFDGNGTISSANGITGGRDTYFGAVVTAGYTF